MFCACQCVSVARHVSLLFNIVNDKVLIYWKRYEKMEKEHRKKAEKEALEQKKHDDELRDVW